jgi:deoxyribonuclease V
MGRLEAGKPAPLIFEGRQVGYALVSKKGTRPIYISPGHRVSLESSLEITQHCIKKHKLPEPTRLAHILADSMK